MTLDGVLTAPFSVKSQEMAGIREALSELRVRKNAIFFRSVTHEAMEMWK